MPKDFQVNQRLFGPKFPDQKRYQADHQNCGCPADPGGAEPVVLLTFIENNLQATQPDSEQAEANAIQLSRMRISYIRRVCYVARDHEHCEDTHRYVDVKSPAPGIGIREPAAKRRPKH